MNKFIVTTTINNIGDADFILGQSPGGSDIGDYGGWEWHNCHGHYHYTDYAYYISFIYYFYAHYAGGAPVS